MNWLKNKQILPIVVLFLILAMTYLYNLQPGNVVQGRQCPLIEGRCALLFDQQQVALEISPVPIVVEEELALRFSYPSNMQLASAWVEGINMFMGRTKVLLSAEVQNGVTTESQGLVFLGSCSEPQMYWRLVAEFTSPGSGATERLYFNFHTKS